MCMPLHCCTDLMHSFLFAAGASRPGSGRIPLSLRHCQISPMKPIPISVKTLKEAQIGQERTIADRQRTLRVSICIQHVARTQCHPHSRKLCPLFSGIKHLQYKDGAMVGNMVVFGILFHFRPLQIPILISVVPQTTGDVHFTIGTHCPSIASSCRRPSWKITAFLFGGGGGFRPR